MCVFVCSHAPRMVNSAHCSTMQYTHKTNYDSLHLWCVHKPSQYFHRICQLSILSQRHFSLPRISIISFFSDFFVLLCSLTCCHSWLLSSRTRFSSILHPFSLNVQTTTTIDLLFHNTSRNSYCILLMWSYTSIIMWLFILLT